MHVMTGDTAKKCNALLGMKPGKGNKKVHDKLSGSYTNWTAEESLSLAQLDAVRAYACVLTLRNTCTSRSI